ncbi:endospore germination permease [Desulfotomaculum defluvii]
MKAETKISPWQATLYIVILILPTAILFVPTITAQHAKQDAWAALLMALLMGLLIAVISSSLAARFPDETVIEYVPKLIGLWPGKVIGFIYASYYYYVSYYVLRQFIELMATAYLVTTPVWIHVIVLTAIACYALYLGIEALVRTNSVITIFLLASILLIFVLALPNIDKNNFTPVLATPLSCLLLGGWFPGSWLGECAVILMLAPFLSTKGKNKIYTVTIFAVMIAFFSMMLINVANIGLFGADVAARMIFPSFSLARNIIFVQAVAIERVDVLFMAIWVAGMAFKLITFFYAGTLAFAQLFKLPDYRILVVPGGILLVILSLNSWNNIAELIEFSNLVFPTSITFVNLLLTSLLLMLSYLSGGLSGGKP